MNNHTHQGQVVSDKLLAEQVAQLPKEMSPERDLWSGIERAISHKSQHIPSEQQVCSDKQSNVFVPSAWAASVVLVMLASWFTFSPSINEVKTPTMAQTQLNEGAEQGQLVNFMQENFKQQKQTLLVSYGQPTLDKLPLAMQQELKKLANARASIRKALLADENNADLLNLLDFTQQQELKLLQQLYRPYQVI